MTKTITSKKYIPDSAKEALDKMARSEAPMEKAKNFKKRQAAVEGKVPVDENGDMPENFLLPDDLEIPEDKPIQAEVTVIEKPSEPEAGMVQKTNNDHVLSIVGGVSTQELKQALEVQTEQRQLIQQFIKDNLVEDIDYGRIHVVKNCPAETKSRGSCTRDYHFSKSILFKPGQEKIFSLFGITDRLEKDMEAYEMLGNVPGLVAYKCVMYRGEKVVGEGRGAATLAGSQSDPNSTIKKAEKRARMDACLSLGFSAYFTQDLDDPEYKSQRDMMNAKAAAEAENRDKDEFGLMPRDESLPINNQERAVLHRLILKAGFTDQSEILELLKINGITDPQSMTSGQARDMMGKIAHSMFSAPDIKPKAPEPTIEPEEVDNFDPNDVPIYDIGGDEPTEPPKKKIEEPELVVDDDLKRNSLELLNSIGLNGRGMMWFMKMVCGKPYGKPKDFTDQEWRKAYDVIQGILDSEIDVDDRYIAGLINEEVDQDATIKPSNDNAGTVPNIFPGAKDITNGDDTTKDQSNAS